MSKRVNKLEIQCGEQGRGESQCASEVQGLGGQEDSSIQPPHNHYALAMCQALLSEYLVLNRTDLGPAYEAYNLVRKSNHRQ